MALLLDAIDLAMVITSNFELYLGEAFLHELVYI